jgi:hypothetical protein
MLSDEEYEKLESQYFDEQAKRLELSDIESKIEVCKEVIKSFTADNPWVSICNVKLIWNEAESDAEGKRCIGSKDKSLKIENPTVFVKGLEEMIKQYENEIKKIKG